MTKREIINEYECVNDSGAYSDNQICSMMNEWAKHQAVEFVKWAIENNKIIGDSWGNSYMPGDEGEMYDKFIQSQQNNG
jgi:hypothetical protein